MRPVILLFGLLGCTVTTHKGGDSGGDTSLVTGTFTHINQNTFQKSCAFSTCHGSASSAGSGGLSLAEDSAYDNLVNVPSVGDPSQIRVVPGDADSSYIIKKLTGASDITGDPMPSGGELPDDQITEIKDWINAGALDN